MIKFTFLVQKLPGMSLEEFVDYHKNQHAPLFCSIPDYWHLVGLYAHLTGNKVDMS